LRNSFSTLSPTDTGVLRVLPLLLLAAASLRLLGGMVLCGYVGDSAVTRLACASGHGFLVLARPGRGELLTCQYSAVARLYALDS